MAGRGSNPKKNFNKNHSQNHIHRKRQASKPVLAENVIYVSTKSSIKGLLERCTILIKDDHKEIIIYCLGAAIQRGILLALQLCEQHLFLTIDTQTLTTKLTDDLEPVFDDADYEILNRYNSALRIRLQYKDPLEECSSQ